MLFSKNPHCSNQENDRAVLVRDYDPFVSCLYRRSRNHSHRAGRGSVAKFLLKINETFRPLHRHRPFPITTRSRFADADTCVRLLGGLGLLGGARGGIGLGGSGGPLLALTGSGGGSTLSLRRSPEGLERGQRCLAFVLKFHLPSCRGGAA